MLGNVAEKLHGFLVLGLSWSHWCGLHAGARDERAVPQAQEGSPVVGTTTATSRTRFLGPSQMFIQWVVVAGISPPDATP